jgi:hypothetical protein
MLAYACFSRPNDEPTLEGLPLTVPTVELVTSNPRGSAGLTNYGVSKTDSKVRALTRAVQTVKGEKSKAGK